MPIQAPFFSRGGADQWSDVDGAAKDANGNYVALKDGQWVPASAAAKNAEGKYKAVLSPRMNPFKAAEELGHAAGEKTVEAVSKATHPGSPLAGIAATAVDIGIGQAPQAAIGSVVGGGVGELGSKLGRLLMKSSIKARGTGETVASVERMTDTALREGINVSAGGVRKINKIVNELNDKIQDMISKSVKTVPDSEIRYYLDELKSGLLKYGVKDPKPAEEIFEQFFKTADRSGATYTVGPGGKLTGTGEIKIQELQRFKQGLSQAISESSYNPASTAVEATATQGRKALQTGAREAISAIEPATKALNLRESELLSLRNPAEKQAIREMASNPGSFGWLASSPETFAAYVMDKSSAFKSISARILYNSGGVPAELGAGAAALPGIRSQQPLEPDITGAL